MESGPHKNVLIPQDSPFQFERIDASPTTTGFQSHQVATSYKDSSIVFVRSSPDAKSFSVSTLACSSSSHTST